MKSSRAVRVGGRSFRSWCDPMLKAVTNAQDPTRYVADLGVLDRESELCDGRTEYRVLVEIVYEDDDYETTTT